MPKQVVFVIYRKWAFEIFKAIADWQKFNQGFDLAAVVTTEQSEFSLQQAQIFAKTAR